MKCFVAERKGRELIKIMELNSAQVNIRDLVAQVKSGQINKKDAFKELHHILKSSGGEVDDGEEEAENTEIAI